MFSCLLPGCLQPGNHDKKISNYSSDGKTSVTKYKESITEKELRDHVFYLASDKLEGRLTGSRGAAEAINYITEFLKKNNIRELYPNTSFTNDFRIDEKKQTECYIESKYGRIINGEDFMEMYSDYYGKKRVELVFAGYGRESDIKNLDVNGKILAYFTGLPDRQEYIEDLEIKKRKLAQSYGAQGTIMFDLNDEELEPYFAGVKRIFSGSRFYFHLNQTEGENQYRQIACGSKAISKIFGTDKNELINIKEKLDKGNNLSGALRCNITMNTSYIQNKEYYGKNIAGIIEGSLYKDEYIVLTAHYDHLGMDNGKIYIGADDNATGVAALLEITEAINEAGANGNRPLRNIIFFFTGAEELELSGSQFFLNQKVIPHDRIIANINMDMLGREDAQRPELKDFVYIYYSMLGEQDLSASFRKAEQENPSGLHFEIRKTYKGSDHYSFERAGIPVLAYSTGHSKDYHQTGDKANLIRYKNFHKITKSIYSTVWEITNREKPIKREISY